MEQTATTTTTVVGSQTARSRPRRLCDVLHVFFDPRGDVMVDCDGRGGDRKENEIAVLQKIFEISTINGQFDV